MGQRSVSTVRLSGKMSSAEVSLMDDLYVHDGYGESESPYTTLGRDMRPR